MVGEFTIDEVLTLGLDALWESTCDGGAIDRTYFDQYFEGRETRARVEGETDAPLSSAVMPFEGLRDQPPRRRRSSTWINRGFAASSTSWRSEQIQLRLFTCSLGMFTASTQRCTRISVIACVVTVRELR